MTLKETIINETCKLFSLRGFMSTSILDVISASKTSKGGLYNHFKSKEELFYAALEYSRKIWREKNLKGLDQIDNPLEKVIRFLENYRDSYIVDAEHFPGGCIFVNLSIELDDQMPQMAREVERGFTGLKRMIYRYLKEAKERNELKEGIFFQDVAEIITSSLIGGAVLYAQNKASSNFNRTMNALIDYIKRIGR